MLSFQLLIKLIIRKNYFFMWYHIHSYQKYKCVNNIAIQYPFKYRFMLIHMCRRSRSRDKKVSSNKKQDIGNHSPQHKEGAILVKDEPLDKVGGAILYYSILQCLVSVQQIMYHIICNSIITSAPRHEIGCSSFWCGCTASFTGTNMMSHTLFIEFGAHLGMICVFALSTFDSSSYNIIKFKGMTHGTGSSSSIYQLIYWWPDDFIDSPHAQAMLNGESVGPAGPVPNF